MQQRVGTPRRQNGGTEAAAVPALPDPAGLLQFQRAWLDTATSLMKMPLSGDVSQWIRAWGEAVGQVGLVNVNYGGSRDVQAEQRITGRYSYGSQLGRMMEVLAPHVQRHQAEFSAESGTEAVKDFLAMADEISALKEASVEDLLAKVKQWQKSDGFEDKLQRLLAGLRALGEGSAP
jgi:hypothetical protein